MTAKDLVEVLRECPEQATVYVQPNDCPWALRVLDARLSNRDTPLILTVILSTDNSNIVHNL